MLKQLDLLTLTAKACDRKLPGMNSLDASILTVAVLSNYAVHLRGLLSRTDVALLAEGSPEKTAVLAHLRLLESELNIPEEMRL